MKSRIACAVLCVEYLYTLSFLPPLPIDKTFHATSVFPKRGHESKRFPPKTSTPNIVPTTQLHATSSSVTWVLESCVFPASHPPLREAITNAGHQLVDWNDDWWSSGFPKELTRDGTRIIFHGSLNNAARIHAEGFWTPGSFCDPASFHCSTWYEGAREWLFQEDWRMLPASSFVDTAAEVGAAFGGTDDRVFVRPDSPLKEFSGRPVDVNTVTLKSLDHGYYYDDESLNVVVCPFREAGREWRFVVAGSSVVAGSAYDAETRTPVVDNDDSQAWSFAQSVASKITKPSDVYVLDVCEDELSKDLGLMELNPFGGADLYACDPNAIVEALATMC